MITPSQTAEQPETQDSSSLTQAVNSSPKSPHPVWLERGLLWTHIQLLCFSIFGLMTLFGTVPSWTAGSLIILQVIRQIHLLVKSKKCSFLVAIKATELLCRVWFLLWYTVTISTSGQTKLGSPLSVTLSGIIITAIQLVIQFKSKLVYPLLHRAKSFAVAWKLCIWVYLLTFTTTSELHPSNHELSPDPDSVSSRLVILTVLFGSTILFAVSLIKTFENMSRMGEVSDSFAAARRRVPWYVSAHLLTNLVLAANAAVVSSNGGIGTPDNTKYFFSVLATVAVAITFSMSLIWRREITMSFLIRKDDVAQLYSSCKVFSAPTRISNSRITRDSAHTGISDSSVMHPVLEGNAPQERDIEMANFSSRSRLTPSPARDSPETHPISSPAANQANQQNLVQKLEVQILEAEQDAHDSLESLRFIERKNSVIFGQVNTKKIEGLLRMEGMLDKSPNKKKDIFSSDLSFKPSSFNSPEDPPNNLDSPITFGPVKRERTPSLQVAKTIISPSIRTRTRSLNLRIDTTSTKYQNIVMGQHTGFEVHETDVFDQLTKAMFNQSNLQNNLLDLQQIGKENLTSLCVVCESKPANCIIYPCYHSKVCYDCCVHMLEWRHSQCHFCRGALEKIIVIDTAQSYRNIFKVLEVFTINYKDGPEDPQLPAQEGNTS